MLPCPFCGNPGEIRSCLRARVRYHWPSCTNYLCLAYTTDEILMFTKPEEALAAWNHRVPVQEAHEL